MPKKAAGIISKAIKSAAANAEDKSGGDASVEDLRIHTIAVDGGTIAKRWMPRSMGRANRINHRTSHLTVVVTDEDVEHHGSEDTSDRLPPRHHQDVVVALVRGEELRQVAARGPQAQGLHQEEAATTRASRYIEIERAANKAKINIHTARPGIVIGKRGAGVETLKKEVQALTENEVFLNIIEVRKAETNAQLVAENIATQLERRIAFRRAMKKATQTAMKFGAKGIKVASSGRLGGAEMCRREWYKEGRVPLHTLRADIEYGFTEAHTTYGSIGVKAWVFHGEVLPTRARTSAQGRPLSAPPLDVRRIAMSMLSPKRTKFRKSHKGHLAGKAKGGNEVSFGDFGLQVTSTGLDHRSPDRGGSRRDLSLGQEVRQDLRPRLPRPPVHEEAGRDPHGYR